MSLVVGASVALTAQVLDFSAMLKDEPPDINEQYSGEWLKIHKEISLRQTPDPFDF